MMKHGSISTTLVKIYEILRNPEYILCLWLSKLVLVKKHEKTLKLFLEQNNALCQFQHKFKFIIWCKTVQDLESSQTLEW